MMFSRNEWAKRRYAEDPEFRKRKLEINERWRKANRAKVNERRRFRWESDPKFRKKVVAYRKALHRLYRLKRYRLSLQEYQALLRKQNGACAICGKKSDKPLCIDNCHVTGIVRGLLCHKCNAGLGFYDENQKFMRAAITYLESFRVTVGLVKRALTGR